MTREEKIDFYCPRVKPAVDRLMEALPALSRHMSLNFYEDLVQAAVIGLMTAVEGRGLPALPEEERVVCMMERCMLEILAGQDWLTGYSLEG